MIGSVVESLVSSSELARSFYENEKGSGEEEFDTEARDGVKAFTKVIDAIVSRFCLELEDTTIRFENPPKFMSDCCTAIEIRLHKIRFMDEQMRNCQQEGSSTETITSQPQGMGSIANLNKFMDISGFEMFTDIFTELDDQYSENNSSQVVTISVNEALQQPSIEDFKITRVDSHQGIDSNPVKFAELVGESRVIFRIKNSDAIVDKRDNTIEIDSFFTGLYCFIIPSQIEILKRFFSSITIPHAEKITDFGKKMAKSDYDTMAKNIEEETFQKTQVATQGLQGGKWKKREDFHEFDSINLEDNCSSKKFGEICRENYITLKADTNKKESTKLSAKIGTVLIIIPHLDMMSVDFVKNLNNGCHESIDNRINSSIDSVIRDSNMFFAKASNVSLKPSSLRTMRTSLDELYNKDHLRLFGTSVLFHYQMDKDDCGEHLRAKLIFPNVDLIEYLMTNSNPRDPENAHIPLLDFSLFNNVDQEPQLKIVYNSSTAGNNESKACVSIGKCRCDLDPSIVDRIPDLFDPQPFFDLPAFRRSRVHNIMRIPIADLREPNGARLPYRERHVHSEYIGLHVNSVTVEVPLGSFCGASEKYTCSEEDRRFVWGGQTSMDEPLHMKLEYDPRNKALKASGTKIHCVSGIADEMIKSISLAVLQSLPQREGPFAQIHRSFLHKHEEGNDLILAGSREEMTSFGAKCILQSAYVVILDIPILRLLIPNHSYLEVLYNRLVNDLLLWHPATLKTRATQDEFKINALGDDMFHECCGDTSDHCDDEYEEDRLQSSMQANVYDRNKSHVVSFLLNVKKSTVMMCTSKSKSDGNQDTCQVSVEFSDAQLFMVSGYHGCPTDTYFYFTSHTFGVGYKDACTMQKAVNQADFGKWTSEETQIYTIPEGDEFNSQSTDDAVGVSIFLCDRVGQNIKDVLLAIAVRNISVQLRPFSNTEETWVLQLAEFFTLQNYPIPGYDLPVVTTDLHIHFDNVVLAYDHTWTYPESDVRLRLVLGESDVSSSIIHDMNVVKLMQLNPWRDIACPIGRSSSSFIIMHGRMTIVEAYETRLTRISASYNDVDDDC
ncbi:hypothetical protein DICVIV_10035 [Dictyocaulus viviparus]|uniref:Autophagy-related protein 2 n=1 Tax=Dictyocaulus viviparus TaxID=29172 RepID=A0A0D8XNJ5_DICVI|nr:hypothetical protein DICVIV_10035 [Dictyocaulus viviparus]